MRTLLLLLAAGTLALSGCSKKSDDEGKKTEAPAPVQVTSVTQDTIRRTVEADGVLFPQNQASITPKISAPVQKFMVSRGDHVKAGEVVALLENRDLSAAVMEGKGALDQAEANFRTTSSATVPEEVIKAESDVQANQEALDAAKRVLDSRQKLLQQGAIARKLMDDAQVAYAQAKGQLDASKEHLRALQSVGKGEQVKAAQAAVEQARGHLQSAEAQVAYSEVRSPISGVIADRPVYPGEMASAGSPLMTIMDISRVVARVNVPQAQATGVKVGQTATISQTGTDQMLDGKVTVVSPATDPNTTTVQVWITAPNPGEKLKPGGAVHASILTGNIRNALIVPASAILPGEEGGTAVLTVTPDSVAHLKKVDVGVRYGDSVQIVSGVNAGDEVVTVGGLGVDDKAKVRIVGAAEENADDEDEDTPAPPDAKEGAPKK